MPAGSGRYPSGQRGQTVNLLAYAFGGSNPPLPTTCVSVEAAQAARGTGMSGNSSAVERQPSKLGVAGSNPVSRSIVWRAGDGLERVNTMAKGLAHVAQLAEHALGKGEVSGSIPDMGSIVERAAGRRGAGVPPSEASVSKIGRVAGRRGAGAPPSEATTKDKSSVIASVGRL
jgi:hypothetical protein